MTAPTLYLDFSAKSSSLRLRPPAGSGKNNIEVVLEATAHEFVWSQAQVRSGDLQFKPNIKQRPPLNFPVVDIGPWPEDWSLRREDWYDEERL